MTSACVPDATSLVLLVEERHQATVRRKSTATCRKSTVRRRSTAGPRRLLVEEDMGRQVPGAGSSERRRKVGVVTVLSEASLRRASFISTDTDTDVDDHPGSRRRVVG